MGERRAEPEVRQQVPEGPTDLSRVPAAPFEGAVAANKSLHLPEPQPLQPLHSICKSPLPGLILYGFNQVRSNYLLSECMSEHIKRMKKLTVDFAFRCLSWWQRCFAADYTVHHSVSWSTRG